VTPALWTLAEENRLRELLPTHSNHELARAFQRSEKAIALKLNRMGLRRIVTRSDGISTTIMLPPSMKRVVQAEADRKKITVGSVIREILAAHYKLEGERTIAVRGGKSRKPRHKLVNNQFVPHAKPSMPFVNIRND
jgi:hypothetical protein